MTKALVFPGQGSQTVGMGKDLYDAYAAARDVFQEVDEALSQSLSKIIFEGPMETLTQTQNAQPALMAMSMAVVRVMQKELGISLQGTFQFVAGHSLGEYSALCAAGLCLWRTRRNCCVGAEKRWHGPAKRIRGRWRRLSACLWMMCAKS